jgi:sugar-specific transcriptional regulator TrmB
MSDQSDKHINLLTPFGLSSEESRIYLHLLQNGIKTALQISRELRVARTKVYRILDKLADRSLVVQLLEGRGLKFQAQSPKQLELLIKDREHQLQALKSSAPTIFQELAQLEKPRPISSQIRRYQGVEGLKQVTWNSLKASKELLIFEIQDMSAFLDHKFSEQVRQEFVRRQVQVRQLTNHRRLSPWTQVSQFVNNYWQCRYLNPQKLKITFEILIYNHTYALYSFKNKQIFCTEIHHPHLADMQKQLFNYLWDQAQPMTILNSQGKAIISHSRKK